MAGKPAGRRLSGRAVADQQPDAVREDQSLTKYQKDIGTLDWLDPVQEATRARRPLLRLACQLRAPGWYYNADLYKSAGLDPGQAACDLGRPRQERQGHRQTGPADLGTLRRDQAHPLVGRPGLDRVPVAGRSASWLSPDEKKAAFNSDAGVEALKFYVDLVNEHKVTPLKVIDKSSVAMTSRLARSVTCSSTQSGSCRAEAMSFPVKVAAMPKHKTSAAPLGVGTYRRLLRQQEQGSGLELSQLVDEAGKNAVFWVSGGQPADQNVDPRDGRLERAHCQASTDAVVPRGPAPSAACLLRQGRPGGLDAGRAGD